MLHCRRRRRFNLRQLSGTFELNLAAIVRRQWQVHTCSEMSAFCGRRWESRNVTVLFAKCRARSVMPPATSVLSICCVRLSRQRVS